MQIPTHILSGWCGSSLFPNLTPRQRLFCMIAAAIPDLDGLSILAGQQSYWNWHHRVCHNLPFGLLSCIILTLLSGKSPRLFLLYLTLFQLHIAMDIFGSGPGWGIFYFWPFSNWMFDNTHLSWEFFSWQNLTIAAFFLLWTYAIALRQKRTPLEALMPALDRQLVSLFGKPFE